MVTLRLQSFAVRSVRSIAETTGRHERELFATVLLLGLLVRLPFAPIDFHGTGDLDTYLRWARSAQEHGLADLYRSTRVDYPPLLLWLLAGAAWIVNRLPADLSFGDPALIALIKLPSMLADLFTAVLIAWFMRSRFPNLQLVAAGVYLFNPAIWYVSSYWGQTDAAYTLFLVASVIALERGAVLPAWIAYALALMTKLQSVALLPLLLIATYARYRTQGLGVGVLGAACLSAAVASPWLLRGRLDDIVAVYTALPSEAPRIDVSAYNFWYLLRLGNVHNVSSATYPLALPLSYQTIAVLLFGLYAVTVAFLALRRETITVSAAALSLGMFELLTQMHERYLFPVLALLVLASTNRSRLWAAYALLSTTFFFNLVTIAPFTPLLGTNLVAAQPDSLRVVVLKELSLFAAAVNTLIMVWLVAEARSGGKKKD